MGIYAQLNHKNYNKLKSIAEIAKNEIIDSLSSILDDNNMLNKVSFIESRIKAYNSLINKMKYKEYELTSMSMLKNINDFIGIRFVCKNINNVYSLVKCINEVGKLKIINEKDYIKNPKKTGYQSYHIIIQYDFNIKNNIIPFKVELQIRTYQMELWANWAHDLFYKKRAYVM